MYIEEKNINQTVLQKTHRFDMETVIELFFSVIFFLFDLHMRILYGYTT